MTLTPRATLTEVGIDEEGAQALVAVVPHVLAARHARAALALPARAVGLVVQRPLDRA